MKLLLINLFRDLRHSYSVYGRCTVRAHPRPTTHLPTTDPELALAQYRRRLRDQPNAISNMHFVYMLALSAIDTIRDTLEFRSVNTP